MDGRLRAGHDGLWGDSSPPGAISPSFSGLTREPIPPALRRFEDCGMDGRLRAGHDGLWGDRSPPGATSPSFSGLTREPIPPALRRFEECGMDSRLRAGHDGLRGIAPLRHAFPVILGLDPGTHSASPAAP